MRNIQDVGLEILNKQPKSFYVFLGPEYGIKCKYIDMISDVYGRKEESESVSDLLSMMSRKQIIPLKPACYIVRYDEQFIASLDAKTESIIQNTNIVGTIVCIYENSKHCAKAGKYLENYSVTIDKVDKKFVSKYLSNDFPNLSKDVIHSVCDVCTDYNQGKIICNCITKTKSSLSEKEIKSLFGFSDISTDSDMRKGVASRNFNYLVKKLSTYSGDINSIFYTILSTLIDLDKLKYNTRIDSDLKDYADLWSYPDIYYMFNHTYDMLKRSRSSSSFNLTNGLIYLFGLLQFSKIPSIGDMR